MVLWGRNEGMVMQMRDVSAGVKKAAAAVAVAGTQAGIDSIWEGKFVGGKWTPGCELNGDDDNQGRCLQLPSNEFVIRMVKLYHCE